jgi:hypothetical protein
VPRVVPKTPRFKPEQTVRAWQAFAVDAADGLPYSIHWGQKLPGDHPAVLAAPWNFVVDTEPNPLDPIPYAEEPAPLFTDGPVRIRATAKIIYGVSTHEKGEVFEADAKAASWLVSEHFAEKA